MEFSEKIDHIMKALGANSSAIAKYAGFDRTNISRIRNGFRIPASSGTTAAKLIEGIYLFADDGNKLSLLCDVIGGDPGDSAAEIRSRIKDWLYDGIPEKPIRSKKIVESYAVRSFGEKFDAVMTLCRLSNIRLSQLINVDASLISRFRTGVRSPRSNPEMARHLADILWERVKWTGSESELAKLISPDLKDVDEDTFFSWLCDFEPVFPDNSGELEKLVDAFGLLSEETPVPDEFSGFEFPVPEDKREIYTGAEGLQEAVIRFLSVVASSGAEEILLYSDENMDWITGSAVFRTKWISLMSRCIKNRTKIRIIHNIDRGFSEMSEALISWLPLYMSGMIESFYCRIPNGKRFSHTIFLCPGKACIEAFHVADAESEGIYHYFTDESLLYSCHKAYKKLLQASPPLIRVTEPSFMIPPEGRLITIQNTPSVATMTEDLADTFACPTLKNEWKHRAEALKKVLEKAFVYECFPLVSPEKLVSGIAKVEPLPGTEMLFYTKEQYVQHIRNIVNLLDTYPSYRFYPLKETPFPNTNIVIGTDYVKVTNVIQPDFSMELTHPVMCRAFRKYADNLRKHYNTDRNTLKRELSNTYELIGLISSLSTEIN